MKKILACSYDIFNYNKLYLIMNSLQNIKCEYNIDKKQIIQFIKYLSPSNKDLTYVTNVNNDMFQIIKDCLNISSDIQTINYMSYGEKDIKITDLSVKSLFDNKEYTQLGKYALLMLYNSNCGKNIKPITINIKSITDTYTKYQVLIKDLFETSNKIFIAERTNIEVMTDLLNEDWCNKFFNMFTFGESLTVEKLHQIIEEIIISKYGNFLSVTNETYQIKLNTIFSHMINNITNVIDESLNGTCIESETDAVFAIDKYIESYSNEVGLSNENDLFHEYLVQNEKIIINIIKSTNRPSIIHLLNNIMSTKIDSVDAYVFFIELLGRRNNILAQTEISHIRNYLFNFMINNKLNDTYEYNFQLYKQMRQIMSPNNSRCYGLVQLVHGTRRNKLIKLFDTDNVYASYFKLTCSEKKIINKQKQKLKLRRRLAIQHFGARRGSIPRVLADRNYDQDSEDDEEEVRNALDAEIKEDNDIKEDNNIEDSDDSDSDSNDDDTHKEIKELIIQTLKK